MDEFFALLNQVSVILLPILGAIALIYLIVLLKRVISVFSRVDAILVDVDKKVTRLDGPLDTLVRLSHSVDKVHDTTYRGIVGLAEFIVSNWTTFTVWVDGIVHKDDTKPQKTEYEREAKDASKGEQ